MTSEHGGFVQFPLCLLATREPMDVWLRRAVVYGVVQFIESTSEPSTDFWRMSRRQQERALHGAQKVIGITLRDVDYYRAAHRKAVNAVAFWKSTHGSTFTVRLKSEYIREVIDEAMLTEREFRVLIGLYSMIGPKSFAKVGWPMIQARAAGHMRPADAGKYLGPVYSRGQIERACAVLLDRKFVASFTYNYGERFWSHRLLADELAAAVKAKKTQMILARQARSERNTRVSTEITERTRPLITCSPPARGKHVTRTSRARPEHVGGHVPEHVPGHVIKNTSAETPQ